MVFGNFFKKIHLESNICKYKIFYVKRINFEICFLKFSFSLCYIKYINSLKDLFLPF